MEFNKYTKLFLFLGLTISSFQSSTSTFHIKPIDINRASMYFEFDASKTTVAQLYQSCSEKSGIPPEYFTLVARGQKLNNDDQTLKSLDLNNVNIIHFIVKKTYPERLTAEPKESSKGVVDEPKEARPNPLLLSAPDPDEDTFKQPSIRIRDDAHGRTLLLSIDRNKITTNEQLYTFCRRKFSNLVGKEFRLIFKGAEIPNDNQTIDPEIWDEFISLIVIKSTANSYDKDNLVSLENQLTQLKKANYDRLLELYLAQKQALLDSSKHATEPGESAPSPDGVDESKGAPAPEIDEQEEIEKALDIAAEPIIKSALHNQESIDDLANLVLIESTLKELGATCAGLINSNFEDKRIILETAMHYKKTGLPGDLRAIRVLLNNNRFNI